MNELRVLAPTAILGYGFPYESFIEGMKEKPHVVSVDAGSTDPGPYYLGEGVSFTDRNAVKRDMEIILTETLKEKIPFIIGTAGGSGAKPHLEWNLQILREIAKEKGWSFKIAVIPSDIDKQVVMDVMKKSQIKTLTPSVTLDPEAVEKTDYIVAQMGIEPIIKALELNPDVILAGRCYDPAVFAALPVKLGYDKGLAMHMGKILECACIAATPGSGSDCMMGYIGEDYFMTKPTTPKRKCTTLSVAAHTLYEKSDPYILPGPGGYLDLTQSVFTQENENTVRVTGSVYRKTPYTIKLEGAYKVGCRTVSIAGSRDPVLIEKIQELIDGVKTRTHDNFKDKLDNYYLNFRIYGLDGVMGALEPDKTVGKEIGIVIEAIGKTQEEANTICSFARSTMLHYGYSGRISTAGNLAFPFSPSDFKAGNVYEFSLYHIMEIDDPIAPFGAYMVDSLE